MDAIKEKSASRKAATNSGMTGEKVTMKDVEIKTCIEDLASFIEAFDTPDNVADEGVAKPGQKKRVVKGKGNKDALLREQLIVAKYSKPNDIQKFDIPLIN